MAGWLGNIPDKVELTNFFEMLRPTSIGIPFLRLGGNGDGGYVVPDDFDGISCCFSPGVSTVADFEKEISDKYGIRSYMADYSVDQPPLDDPNFSFIKKFIGTSNDDVFIRLDDWFNASTDNDTSDKLLQMDIEGAEYDIILDMSDDVLKQFRTLVFEFHDLDRVFKTSEFTKINAAFKKLLEHFIIVHIHPNNYCPNVRCGDFHVPMVLEMTLLRKDRASPSEKQHELPHPLDQINAPHKPDIKLPDIWL